MRYPFRQPLARLRKTATNAGGHRLCGAFQLAAALFGVNRPLLREQSPPQAGERNRDDDRREKERGEERVRPVVHGKPYLNGDTAGSRQRSVTFLSAAPGNGLHDSVAIFSVRVNRDTGGLSFTGQYVPVGNPSIVVLLDLA